MHQQLQCPLFEKLSAELRLFIYEFVLGDHTRLLHICKNLDSRRSVAHYRCTDTDSPYPTWQHACFGEERIVVPGKYSSLHSRANTETDDNLISLLLTCRRICFEAFPTLYETNIFHFRGAPGVLSFRSSVSPKQWTTIRHIHISTIFSATSFWDAGQNSWPPEFLGRWSKCCEHLSELPKLQTLKFDLMMRNKEFAPYYNFEKPKDNILRDILKPLKYLKATVFEVEINVEIPEKVWRDLGEVGFTVVVRERLYNKHVFGWVVLYDTGP